MPIENTNVPIATLRGRSIPIEQSLVTFQNFPSQETFFTLFLNRSAVGLTLQGFLIRFYFRLKSREERRIFSPPILNSNAYKKNSPCPFNKTSHNERLALPFTG